MAKSNPSLMVSAAGMFLNFVSTLEEELTKAGGFPAMLYFAQRKHAQPMMALLARTIVESKLWKVPKSLILAEIEKAAYEESDDGFLLEHWQGDFWAYFSPTALALSTLRFYDPDPVHGDRRNLRGAKRGIPNVGKYETCGDVVEFNGSKYVVTLSSDGDGFLFLAPAEWIDLDA